jgi:predicted PurR-regulated permease PerM
MLGFDRRAARIAWTVALVALALFATWSIRHTIFIFVLAVFFSYMVYPLVRVLNRYTPKRVSHSVSTGVVFALLLLVLVGLIALAGPPIADQASILGEKLPELTRDTSFIDRIPLPDWLVPFRSRIASFVRDHLANGTAMAVPVAQQVGHTLLLVASNLIYIVLIPILAFLFIIEGASIRDSFLAWTSTRRDAPMWGAIVDDMDTLLGRYMRALLILSLATMVSYSIVFTLAGLPYGLLLAVVAGVLEFIPVLGPLAAAVACVLVAGMSGYSHLLFIIGFIAAYRIFQDYVLNPKLMSNGVSLPPLLVLFGLLAGEEIAGVIGVFLSVPVLAGGKIAIFRIAQASRRKKAIAAAAPAGTVTTTTTALPAVIENKPEPPVPTPSASQPAVVPTPSASQPAVVPTPSASQPVATTQSTFRSQSP